MAKVTEEFPELPFPQVQPVVRETGEAVVELRQDGELVGEINFTKIFTGWGRRLGLIGRPKPDLKSVP